MSKSTKFEEKVLPYSMDENLCKVQQYSIRYRFFKLNFKLQKPCECTGFHAGGDSVSQISLGTSSGIGFVQGRAYQYSLLLVSLFFLQVSWVSGVFPYVYVSPCRCRKNTTFQFRNFDAFVIRIKFPSHVHPNTHTINTV